MGHYVDNNLVEDERVEYETDFHWIIFFSLPSLFTLFLKPIIDMWTSEFTITNKRVIIKTGLISINTVEINLQRIESVNVDQSILGRLLGFGDIDIVGTGGTREKFRNIVDPLLFRKRFQDLSLN
jgi:uncharacterized membrane protein YdbT with pleckstrin-like domain